MKRLLEVALFKLATPHRRPAGLASLADSEVPRVKAKHSPFVLLGFVAGSPNMSRKMDWA